MTPGETAELSFGVAEEQLHHLAARLLDFWIAFATENGTAAAFLGRPNSKDRLGELLIRKHQVPPLLAVIATVVAFAATLELFQ
jgi:hypothetical protein